MKRESSGDFEKDPVWDLLRQGNAHRPSPDFAANVVRAARLTGAAKPWWSRFVIPVSVCGALAGATALVMVTLSLQSGAPGGSSTVVEIPRDSSLADLQDDYETEVFLAASDHLGDYSDEELVSMMGF